MKTVIDIDDEALQRAARELGTKSKKDTVNAALIFVAERRKRAQELMQEPWRLGVGTDIGDAEVMASARR